MQRNNVFSANVNLPKRTYIIPNVNNSYAINMKKGGWGGISIDIF